MFQFAGTVLNNTRLENHSEEPLISMFSKQRSRPLETTCRAEGFFKRCLHVYCNNSIPWRKICGCLQ